MNFIAIVYSIIVASCLTITVNAVGKRRFVSFVYVVCNVSLDSTKVGKICAIFSLVVVYTIYLLIMFKGPDFL